jgi:hypothetical protein
MLVHRQIDPKKCLHPPEEKRISIFEVDSETYMTVRKAYECKSCGMMYPEKKAALPKPRPPSAALKAPRPLATRG